MKKVAAILFYVGYCYACLIALNFVLFKFGNSLPFPDRLKEICTSLNYFDYTTHPLYRKEWKGFVMEPGKPWKYKFRGDAYKAFDIPGPSMDFELPVDDLGFVNEIPIQEAQALMIGDSFVRSSGCDIEGTLPSQLSRSLGVKVYGAGHAGYGWAHYLELFRWFVRSGPSSARFKGSDAFIMFYAGNDFSDTMTFVKRRENEVRPKRIHYLQLRTLKELSRMAYGNFLNHGRRLLNRPLDTSPFDGFEAEFKPYTTSSTGRRDQPTQEMTRGLYPHYLNLAPYKGVPFAFNMYIREYQNIDWLMNEAMKAEFNRILTDFKKLETDSGIRLHFILQPNNVQVLEPYIITNDPPKYSFEQALRPAVMNFDKTLRFAESELREHGFDVINLRPTLVEKVKTDRIWWHNDTHLTPLGNKVVSDTIAQHIRRKKFDSKSLST